MAIPFFRSFSEHIQKTPFIEQSVSTNVLSFGLLIDPIDRKEDFLPLIQFIHSNPFMGNDVCLNMIMRKITLCDAFWVLEFNRRYFFGGIQPIFNFHALQSLIEKKTAKGPLPISSMGALQMVDKEELKEILHNLLSGEENKRAFIVIDYHFNPCHYFTIGFEMVNGRLSVLLCESIDLQKTPTPKKLQKALKSLSKEINVPVSFYEYPFARQKDRVSCAQFAFNDAVQFCKTEDIFSLFPVSKSKAKYRHIAIDRLPPKMMKYTQFSLNPAYHTYSTLSTLDPDGASVIGRYLTLEEINLHSAIKRTKAIAFFLSQEIETSFQDPPS